MRMQKIPACILCALMLCACTRNIAGNDSASENPAAETLVMPPVPASVESDAFALQAFRHLLAEQQGNVVFSPAGLEGVLKLLQQGARGKVAAELAALPMGRGEGKGAMQVSESNALFVAENLKLKPGVKSAAVMQAPFADNPAEARQLINEWANDSTRGMIPQMVDVDLPRTTRLVAANAVVLDEKWLLPFKEKNTEPQDFHLADGSTKQVPMMYKRDYFHYAAGKDWEAVALFYRTDGRPGTPGCFIGILPKGDARAFAARLTTEKMSAIRRQLAVSGERELEVRLPKFETTTPAFSLKQTLQACGARGIFLPGADFSGFADEPLMLDEIQQKCYTKVDEQGTKAAAVTIGMVPLCVNPVEPKKITFDRPFLWVIGDLTSPAAPWFMGLCEEP